METVIETKTEKKYPIIYVDAPWDAQAWSFDRVRALPVEKWAAPDALLLMWVAVPLLADALSLLRTWGFDYAGLLAWRKPKDDLEGYRFISDCEYILVGKRGTAKASYFLRHKLYEGSQSNGGYKPEAFRGLLSSAGIVSFEKTVAQLNLFGAFWQKFLPDYKKRDWDFLEG